MSRNEPAPEWESQAHAMFGPLRDQLPAEPSPTLAERSVERVKTSIAASDLVELSTVVLVKEFLGPILDLFAFALGFEEQQEKRGE